MMPKLSAREKNLSVGLGLFLLLVALYVFVVEPGAVRWKIVGAEIGQKSLQLDQDRRLLADSKAIEEEYGRYPGLKGRAVSDEAVVAEALAEIERISQTSSCQIINIKPRSPVREKRFRKVSFDVTGEGDISAVVAFLYAVETSTQTLRVERFTLVPTFGSPGRLKATFFISKIIIV